MVALFDKGSGVDTGWVEVRRGRRELDSGEWRAESELLRRTGPAWWKKWLETMDDETVPGNTQSPNNYATPPRSNPWASAVDITPPHYTTTCTTTQNKS